MTNKIHITTPLTDEIISNLKSGDEVLISGTIYTARDAAHKKLIDSINSGESLPFDIKNAIIYYVGPSPKKPGDVIGSAGPTTSYRMDAYTPTLLDLGLKGMIGKGSRNKNVVESIKKNHAVYFAAIGGAGALISSTIKSSEVIAYEELGPEAVHMLTVENFPAIVVLDSNGNDLYTIEREKYKK
ncbi:Fe-S-containing hydro-lyase [Acetoanaerobium sticklandii]|uniref:Fe-S-containing hydro-lyase n=1 Tax=Acetoanaerobium sticklandii TaxID=1511 RepID=UPI003A8F87DB